MEEKPKTDPGLRRDDVLSWGYILTTQLKFYNTDFISSIIFCASPSDASGLTDSA